MEQAYSIKINRNGIETFSNNKNPMTNEIKETLLGFISIGDFKKKIEKNPLNIIISNVDDIKMENDSFIKLGLQGLNFLQSPDIQNQKSTFESQKSLVFGDEKKPWNEFNDLMKVTATWLYDNGRLQSRDLPVFVPRGKRYLINSIPFHNYIGKDGKIKEFDGKPCLIAKDMWLNTNFDGGDCKVIAEYMMKRFAPDISFKIWGFNQA